MVQTRPHQRHLRADEVLHCLAIVVEVLGGTLRNDRTVAIVAGLEGRLQPLLIRKVVRVVDRATKLLLCLSGLVHVREKLFFEADVGLLERFIVEYVLFRRQF